MTSNKIETDSVLPNSINYDNNLNNFYSNIKDDYWSKLVKQFKIANVILKFFYYVVLIITLIVFTLTYNINQNKIDDKLFKYTTASEFGDVEYFGKENILKEITGYMVKMTEMSEKYKKGSKLSISDTLRNFLFYGPPGTGKTHFVKKLAYNLNEKLKKNYKTNKDCVRVFMVSSSMLESKWLGESEKNIHKLFELARDDKNWKATFIFLDEIDSFFGKRESVTSEDRLRVKSEFLNLMNGTLAEPDKNVFFIGATNLKSHLDDAFLRRLSNQYKFDYPTLELIKKTVFSKIKNWPGREKINLENIEALCSKIYEMKLPQSRIVETINAISTFNTDTAVVLFDKLNLKIEEIYKAKQEEIRIKETESRQSEMILRMFKNLSRN